MSKRMDKTLENMLMVTVTGWPSRWEVNRGCLREAVGEEWRISLKAATGFERCLDTKGIGKTRNLLTI